MTDWEAQFANFLHQQGQGDIAHDESHIRRVVANARALAATERANLMVVIPAAWLHDCVTVPKDSPLRSQASQMAAAAAGTFLHQAGYPAQYIPAIQHAIAAHSFTAGITPTTLEAQIVQDADRLDSLGAIGTARCLMLGATLGRALYSEADPFADNRQPDDLRYTIDHFYVKLLRLTETMQTAAGRTEAERRTVWMRQFLDQLAGELGAVGSMPSASA